MLPSGSTMTAILPSPGTCACADLDTPGPISATIDLVSGDVRISASDRGATLVEVQPSDASNEDDRKAAERTRIEYANEQLLVKAPKLRSWLPTSSGGSIEVKIELPAGSRVHGTATLADFHYQRTLEEES